ncbi:MAG TPA: GAF domain-containing protein [Ideonella sp.]|nr:GAF domain-containing protein [Ideonella sp.]
MNTLIKVTEVWRPSADGSLLEFGGGLYGDAGNFGRISRQMCFGKGEGLPGRAWDAGQPILLKQLQGSWFRRSEAAAAAGLACAMALPIFVRGQLTAVLVFLLGELQPHGGAVELWRNDPRVSTDLKLVDGAYGSGEADFEALTRDTYLSRGAGLPGLAWQREGAVFMNDLATAPGFLRSESAVAAGLEQGLALPCGAAGHENHVLTLLSGLRTPLAGRIESWLPDADEFTLRRQWGHCELKGSLPPALMPLTDDMPGCLVSALRSGVPCVSHRVAEQPEPVSNAARDAGLASLVALPIVCDGEIGGVLALYF